MRRNWSWVLRIAFLFAAILCVPSFARVTRAQKSYEISFESNVPVKMRDGVTLRADIYRPKTDEKLPVLLTRTPYDKTRNWIKPFAHLAAARGYVVIIQDVRGRYESEGEWYPFKREAEDGYDTIEWAGTLPYTNGKVGMFGGSYVGADKAAAFGGNLSYSDGFELSRELDVSRWSVRTVVQPIVDFRAGGKHRNAAVERIEDRD